MKSGRHPNTEALDRAARAVAQHGPERARFLADVLVSAALNTECDRLNAGRRAQRASARSAVTGIRSVRRGTR